MDKEKSLFIVARNYIRVQKGNVEAVLDVFIYENDGFQVVYAPALDLMGYGKTEEDAKSSFDIVAEDFFEYTIVNNTLGEYLTKHGWVARKTSARFVPPQIEVLLEHNKTLREIFKVDFRKQSVPFNYAFSAC
ncbi:MAG: hypothetical protein IKG92_03180 [Bacteroidales bacterium]|nr:hypothetical protein [Bacteroidales bacterium]